MYKAVLGVHAQANKVKYNKGKKDNNTDFCKYNKKGKKDNNTDFCKYNKKGKKYNNTDFCKHIIYIYNI